jgi:hypothetical protein
MNIIALALKNMYNKIDEYKKFNNAEIYKSKVLITDVEIEVPRFEIINIETNKIEAKGTLTLIGSHYFNENLWVWGWYVPLEQKNLTLISRKLLLYGLDFTVRNISNLSKSDILNIIIRNILLTGSIKIHSAVQIKIIVALSLYLTKYDIMAEQKKDNCIYYYLKKFD